MGRLGSRLPRYPIGTTGVTDVVNLEDDEKINFGDAKDVALYWDASNLVFNPVTGETLTFNFAAGVTTISGGADTANDLFLKGNVTDDYPIIRLYGNSALEFAGAAAQDIVFKEATATRLTIQGSTDNVGINGFPPSAHCDLALMSDGVLCLKEGALPTADADYGKIWTESDNQLHFQDGAGTEYIIDMTPA